MWTRNAHILIIVEDGVIQDVQSNSDDIKLFVKDIDVLKEQGVPNNKLYIQPGIQYEITLNRNLGKQLT